MFRFSFGSIEKLSEEEVKILMELINDDNDKTEEELEKQLAELEEDKFKEVNFITPVVIIMHNALCFHKDSFKLWGCDHIVDSLRDNLDYLETDKCLYILVPDKIIFDLLYNLPVWCGSAVQIL